MKSAQYARRAYESARLYFARYECALAWPPAMWLRPRGAGLWVRYCRDFLRPGVRRERGSVFVDLAIAIYSLRDVARGEALWRQFQIAALAGVLARCDRDAPPRPGFSSVPVWTSIDSAFFKTEEGVCYE